MLGEEETNQTNATGEKVVNGNEDYIAAINELKKNSVPRSELEKLQADNKSLLQALVNGQEASTNQTVIPTAEDIKELRKGLFESSDHKNLEFAIEALALREALLAQGKQDPFLPFGSSISPTENDIAAANKVATVLKECIDYANGDSTLFTQELQRRTLDVRLVK